MTVNAVIPYMNNLIVILVPTILVAAVVFFAYARKLSASHSAHRKAEMRALATRINFDFSPADDTGIARRVESEKVLFYGHTGTAENLISGKKNGISVNIFDYFYSDLQKRKVTVCMLTVPADVSTFKIFPLDNSEIASGTSAKLGDKLLGEKHWFECEDREFVEKAFNDDLIDFLSRRRRTTILAHANTIVLHRDKILGAGKCYGLLDFAFGVYSKMGFGGRPSKKNGTGGNKDDTLDIEADLYAD